MYRVYKLLTALLAAVMILAPTAVFAANDSEIIIDSVKVDSTGAAEAIGHITNATAYTQATNLVMTKDGNENGTIITGDTVLWIDQITVGRNGTFLFKFSVPPKFSKDMVVFRFGTDSGAESVSIDYEIPELPPDITCVANNSALYGQDVYTLDSIYLKAQYVTDSIIHGGNIIYYKIGGRWYDLLDPAATSSAYLVSANAESDTDMKKLPLRYYYTTAKKTDFAN